MLSAATGDLCTLMHKSVTMGDPAISRVPGLSLALTMEVMPLKTVRRTWHSMKQHPSV
jgi:hypothetical protein